MSKEEDVHVDKAAVRQAAKLLPLSGLDKSRAALESSADSKVRAS